jgi:hypothetical protein
MPWTCSSREPSSQRDSSCSLIIDWVVVGAAGLTTADEWLATLKLSFSKPVAGLSRESRSVRQLKCVTVSHNACG